MELDCDSTKAAIRGLVLSETALHAAGFEPVRDWTYMVPLRPHVETM